MPQRITNISVAFADFDNSEVMVAFSAFVLEGKCPFWLWEGFLRGWGRPPKAERAILWDNEAQEMTPKLLALTKVCSVLGNIRDVLSWHLSKRESELEKRRTFSFLDKNGAHNNSDCLLKALSRFSKCQLTSLMFTSRLFSEPRVLGSYLKAAFWKKNEPFGNMETQLTSKKPSQSQKDPFEES